MHQSRLILLIVLIIVIILIIVCVSRDCKKHRSSSKRRTKIRRFKKCTAHLPCTGRICQEECGNVNEGCVDLIYEEIYDDLFSDEAEAIYHQYIWTEYVPALTKYVKTQKEFSVPVDCPVQGTEADCNSIVYGYDVKRNGDTVLDLNGGKKKSYPKSLKCINVKYNGLDPEEHLPGGLTFPAMCPIVKHVLSYYLERGYQIPPPDVPSNFENQFIWTVGAGNQNGIGNGFISMKLIFSGTNEAPDFLDLIATGSVLSSNRVLGLYEPNPLNRKNGYMYPIRIPVTTDFCGTFQEMYGREPIVYLDEECNVITVHVPFTEEGHLISAATIETGNPGLDFYDEDYLQYFDASFKLLRREEKVEPATSCKESCSDADEHNENSNLISSNARRAELLAQVSTDSFWGSRNVYFGDDYFFPQQFPIRLNILELFGEADTRNYYFGLVLPLMNGGSKSLDVYALNTPIFTGGYAPPVDPLDFPGGDNPNTTLKEIYALPSCTTISESTKFQFFSYRLPREVLNGKFCPEQVTQIPPFESLSVADASVGVIGHEFMHLMQSGSGVIFALPYESMAQGMQLDPKLNKNLFEIPLAARVTGRGLILPTRGRMSPMQGDGGSSTTYGMGIFWKYLSEQFDGNYQIPRRVMDIMTNETMGPLHRLTDFPLIGQPYLVNNTGGNAALEQALSELYEMKYADVWFNFMVSITMFRNNKAIPKKYRHCYPYWIWNSQYMDYDKIVLGESMRNVPTDTTDWWERLDNNGVITPATFNQFVGETLLRTLTANFVGSCKNYYGFSFNVTHVTQSLQVTSALGTWRVMVFQFTPRALGDFAGSWIQDGEYILQNGQSKTFQISNHVPAYSATGNIRLVCANVTPLTGDGTQLADYYQPEPNTGTINITLN